jgi:hypothetical protein
METIPPYVDSEDVKPLPIVNSPGVAKVRKARKAQRQARKAQRKAARR